MFIFWMRKSMAFIAMLVVFCSFGTLAGPSKLTQQIDRLVSVRTEYLPQDRAQIVLEFHGQLEKNHDLLEIAFSTGNVLAKIQKEALALSQQKTIQGVALVVEKENGQRIYIEARNFPCDWFPELCEAMDFLQGVGAGAVDFGWEDLKTLGAGAAFGPIISAVIKSNPIGMAVVVALIASEIQPMIDAEYQRLKYINQTQGKGWTESEIAGRVTGYVIRQVAIAWVGGRSGNEMVSLLRKVASKNRFANILVTAFDNIVASLRAPVTFPKPSAPPAASAPKPSGTSGGGSDGGYAPSTTPRRGPSGGGGGTAIAERVVTKSKTIGSRTPRTPSVPGIPISPPVAAAPASSAATSLTTAAVATTTIPAGTRSVVTTPRQVVEQYNTVAAYHAVEEASGHLGETTRREQSANIDRWKGMLLHPENTTVADQAFVITAINEVMSNSNTWIPLQMLDVLPLYADKSNVPEFIQARLRTKIAAAHKAEAERKIPEIPTQVKKRSFYVSTLTPEEQQELTRKLKELDEEMNKVRTSSGGKTDLQLLEEVIRTGAQSDMHKSAIERLRDACMDGSMSDGKICDIVRFLLEYWGTDLTPHEQRYYDRLVKNFLAMVPTNEEQLWALVREKMEEYLQYPDEAIDDTIGNIVIHISDGKIIVTEKINKTLSKKLTEQYYFLEATLDRRGILRFNFLLKASYKDRKIKTQPRSHILYGSRGITEFLRFYEEMLRRRINGIESHFVRQLNDRYNISDNHRVYTEGIKRGLSWREALDKTWSAKEYKKRGYTEATPVSVEEPIEPEFYVGKGIRFGKGLRFGPQRGKEKLDEYKFLFTKPE